MLVAKFDLERPLLLRVDGAPGDDLLEVLGLPFTEIEQLVAAATPVEDTSPNTGLPSHDKWHCKRAFAVYLALQAYVKYGEEWREKLGPYLRIGQARIEAAAARSAQKTQSREQIP